MVFEGKRTSKILKQRLIFYLCSWCLSVGAVFTQFIKAREKAFWTQNVQTKKRIYRIYLLKKEHNMEKYNIMMVFVFP